MNFGVRVLTPSFKFSTFIVQCIKPSFTPQTYLFYLKMIVVDQSKYYYGKYILLWYSRIILNIQTEAKICFRKLEAAKKKLTKFKFHLEFNELCIQENPLPTYTNIYIYIYMHTRTRLPAPVLFNERLDEIKKNRLALTSLSTPLLFISFSEFLFDHSDPLIKIISILAH